MVEKVTNNPFYYFLNYLSRENVARFLQKVLKKRIKQNYVGFSKIASKSSNVLFVLPKDCLETSSLFPAISMLKSCLNFEQITFLCVENVVEMISGVYEDINIIKYEFENTKLFSKESSLMIKEINNYNFDICFNLQGEEEILLSSVIAGSNIPVRISKFFPDSEHFYNVSVKVDESKSFIGSVGMSMANFICNNNKITFDKFVWPDGNITIDDVKSSVMPRFKSNDINKKKFVGISAKIDSVYLLSIIQELVEQKVRVILFIENKDNKENYSHFYKSSDLVYTFYYKTLNHAAVMLKRCKVFVTAPEPLLYVSCYTDVPAVLLDKEESADKYFYQNKFYKSIIKTEDIKADVVLIKKNVSDFYK